MLEIKAKLFTETHWFKMASLLLFVSGAAGEKTSAVDDFIFLLEFLKTHDINLNCYTLCFEKSHSIKWPQLNKKYVEVLM